MEIVGHQRQWSYLRKIAKEKKFSHAYLFVGQSHLGKKFIALNWISLIFNQRLENHPDFILIEPEKDQIRISQIRELSWRLSLKPILAPLKAAILNEAHQMTKEAQNCFLKTLEEPKGKALLILITNWPERLLPTIRSRCEILKFYPLPKREIEEYLKKKGILKEKREEILKLALGRPGVVIDLIAHPQKLENQKEIIKKLREISNSPLVERFQYAKTLAREENLREVLDVWLLYFRNLLIENPKDFSPRLKKIIKEIQEIDFLLKTTNLNPTLALEVLMLEL